jgi:hypothetical protein
LGNFSRKFKHTKATLAAAGIQTAALAFGGYITAETAVTEEYNGTSWASNPTGLNTIRRQLAGCGTQTAALAFGGRNPPGTDLGSTEEYDGSAWTTVNSKYSKK